MSDRAKPGAENNPAIMTITKGARRQQARKQGWGTGQTAVGGNGARRAEVD